MHPRCTRSWSLRAAGLLALAVAAPAQAPHGGAQLDAIVQQAYLKASNTGASDRFAWSVALSGDTLVVGAFGESSNATGVDGDEGNDGAPGAGAAYVFLRSGATWTQQAYLKASNTGANDAFGMAVAVSGDTLVVGAPGESSNATGVNGDQGNEGAPGAGAAYVFVRSGATWTQQAWLKASNTEAGDGFGGTVAIDGDTVVVGALFEDSIATGVNGDQADNSASAAGAAYVFVRNGTSWSQQAYLKASNTGTGTPTGDNLCSSISISGDTIVIGADAEDSNATGVNGNQADNSAMSAGAAYVYVRSGTTWSQQAYLKASNTGGGDQFGEWVSISGDTLLAGASTEDSAAIGVNGSQASNAASGSGAAYVFVRTGSTWSQQAYLKASNTGADDRFGRSVSLSGDIVIVGAWQEDSSATGANGDGTSNAAPGSGAAYVFRRNGAAWNQLAYLKASNTDAGDWLGFSVSISGDTVVAGAASEASSATGVNGNQADNGAGLSGAAYVIDVLPDPWVNLGFGLAGTSGVPVLAATGTLLPGSAGTMTLSNAAPFAISLQYISLASSPVPFKCGTLVPFPVLLQLVLVTDGTGSVPLAWSSWASGLSGLNIYFQVAIQDAGAPCGVALSTALRADVP